MESVIYYVVALVVTAALCLADVPALVILVLWGLETVAFVLYPIEESQRLVVEWKVEWKKVAIAVLVMFLLASTAWYLASATALAVPATTSMLTPAPMATPIPTSTPTPTPVREKYPVCMAPSGQELLELFGVEPSAHFESRGSWEYPQDRWLWAGARSYVKCPEGYICVFRDVSLGDKVFVGSAQMEVEAEFAIWRQVCRYPLYSAGDTPRDGCLYLAWLESHWYPGDYPIAPGNFECDE